MKLLINLIFEKNTDKRIFLMLLGIIISISTSVAQEYSEERKTPENTLFYMERTQCYGTCPVYSYYLFEDGTARYHGKENVDKKGTYYSSVPPEKLDELIQIFYNNGFFEFENRYVDQISDLPTTYLYFSHNGEEKKITDYYGAPESLKKLEKELDVFMQSLRWEKIED